MHVQCTLYNFYSADGKLTKLKPIKINYICYESYIEGGRECFYSKYINVVKLSPVQQFKTYKKNMHKVFSVCNINLVQA